MAPHTQALTAQQIADREGNGQFGFSTQTEPGQVMVDAFIPNIPELTEADIIARELAEDVLAEAAAWGPPSIPAPTPAAAARTPQLVEAPVWGSSNAVTPSRGTVPVGVTPAVAAEYAARNTQLSAAAQTFHRNHPEAEQPMRESRPRLTPEEIWGPPTAAEQVDYRAMSDDRAEWRANRKQWVEYEGQLLHDGTPDWAAVNESAAIRARNHAALKAAGDMTPKQERAEWSALLKARSNMWSLPNNVEYAVNDVHKFAELNSAVRDDAGQLPAWVAASYRAESEARAALDLETDFHDLRDYLDRSAEHSRRTRKLFDFRGRRQDRTDREAYVVREFANQKIARLGQQLSRNAYIDSEAFHTRALGQGVWNGVQAAAATKPWSQFHETRYSRLWSQSR